MDGAKIVGIAKKYEGFSEKPGNSGFKNAEFEKRMKQVGWIFGQAWCAYYGELVWRESAPEIDKVLSKLFSGSALQTLHNFMNAGWETGQEPRIGALAIFSHGRGPTGHLSIVTDFIDVAAPHRYFNDISGNSNPEGGREGYTVAPGHRLMDQPFSEHGLNFVAFVYPKAA